ncbi:MAG: ribonuclease E/G [Clostridia bacterium]
MPEPMRILVRASPETSRIALLDERGLCEFYQEEASAESLVGAIFLGRVERVLPDVKAAFIRIGLPLNGFLPLKESESYHRQQGNRPLMSGQELLVQVKKDPKGGKGAFLTRDIALPGQYVLLMPHNLFIGTSKRFEADSDRKRAHALGKELAGERFGLIVRHAALFASREEIQNEVTALWELWQGIAQKAEYQKAPAQMHREPSMLSVLLRDYTARHSIEVAANVPRPHDIAEDVPWQCLPAVELEALWQGKRIDAELSKALNRRVELAQGGSLVIDEREALQTVDLNSGSVVKAVGEEALPLAQNLQAVHEIARQIRLRNLSGILLVDFIDMSSDEERAQVQEAMTEAVRDDRVKTVVHGFTSLGLLEMTRKRTRDTLRDSLTEPCQYCHESGRMLRG